VSVRKFQKPCNGRRCERLERWSDLLITLLEFEDAVRVANTDRVLTDAAEGGILEWCEGIRDTLLNDMPRR
jgi:hypothetical protein